MINLDLEKGLNKAFLAHQMRHFLRQAVVHPQIIMYPVHLE